MDVSATTGLSPALLARIRDVFGRYPEVQRAVIYGSRAKGSFIPVTRQRETSSLRLIPNFRIFDRSVFTLSPSSRAAP